MSRKRHYPPYFSASVVRDRSQRFAAFDFETADFGGKLLLSTLAFYNDLGEMEHRVCSGDPVQIIEQTIDVMLANHKHTWFAHNAQYDWRYMLDYIKSNKVKHEIFMRSKTDIYMISLEIDGKRIVMQDSLAIWPGTLKTLLEQYAPNLPKLMIDDISNFNPNNPSHIEYAVRDSVGLAAAMTNLNEMVKTNYNISLRGTAASTALSAWERQIEDTYFLNETNEDYIRSSYYGGIVFLTTTNEQADLETYDINSSYPHQMRSYSLPYGNIYRTLDYVEGKYGIYTVTLDSGKCLFPCVPYRPDGGGIIWPLGTFKTTITNIELEFAISKGYELVDIHDGVIFDKECSPFESFVETCEKIRATFKGKPQETLAKLLQNSLYGKFGSRRERTVMFVPESDDEMIDAQPWDEDQFWFVKTEKQDMRCMVHWAVFITARARLHLLKQVFAVGIENVVYGDTDSLTVVSGHNDEFDIGIRYGQWKLEKRWKRFRAIAPKVYSGLLSINRNNNVSEKFSGAAKGLPSRHMDEKTWKALIDNEPVSVDYRTLSSLRVSMKRGIIGASDVSRVVTNIANSKGWVLCDGGQVRPRLLSAG